MDPKGSRDGLFWMRNQIMGEWKTDMPFHGGTKRAGTEVFVETGLEQKRENVFPKRDGVAALGQELPFPVEMNPGDLDLDFVGEFAKDQLGIDAAQKFGPESRGDLRQNVFFDLDEVKMPGPENVESAEIGRKDDVEAGEIKSPARTAGNSSRVEDLQENVDDPPMGLFDFINQEDAFLVAGQMVAQPSQTAGLVADEIFNRVLGREFRHIETKRFFLVMETLGQHAGQFGFPDAGRPDKQERPFWPAGRGESRFPDNDPLNHGGDDMILAANCFAQILFQSLKAVVIGVAHNQAVIMG